MMCIINARAITHYTLFSEQVSLTCTTMYGLINLEWYQTTNTDKNNLNIICMRKNEMAVSQL